MNTITSIFDRIGGKTPVDNFISVFYHNMLDDYHVNRFFNDKEIPEQAQALTDLIIAAASGVDKDTLTELMDDFFMKAFARSKRKSFVSGSDFGFLGLLIEQDQPETHLLCDAHAYLLKFMPDDSHFDAVIENLKNTLQAFNLNGGLKNDILELAEANRNKVLGR